MFTTRYSALTCDVVLRGGDVTSRLAIACLCSDIPWEVSGVVDDRARGQRALHVVALHLGGRGAGGAAVVVGRQHGRRSAVVVVVVAATAVASRALPLPLQKLCKAAFPWGVF